MNITKEEVQRLIEAFHADPHTADWDDALSLLRAKRDEKDAEPCAWTLDDDFDMGDTYHSSCGELWSFIDGGPKENNVRFCHGCGKAVEIKELK